MSPKKISNYDDYIREIQEDKGQAVWVVELSNGEKFYQDDFRPELADTHSAWLRLKKICHENKLSIVNLYLQFRDIVHKTLPQNKKAYFFSRNIIADLQSSLNNYMIGFYEPSDDSFYIEIWNVPCLILVERIVRKKQDCTEDSVIWNEIG